MFGFFKNKNENAIYAPVKGTCIDITEVNDIGFSSKIMGDGVAIVPTEGIVTAPCDGRISMIFDTGHAFGIEANNGAEILIHIGIDTVNLNGEGFEILKKTGQKVKKGEPVIRFELEKVKKLYDTATMVIMTNGKSFVKTAVGYNVDNDTKIFGDIQ
mgnify:FL=1